MPSLAILITFVLSVASLAASAQSAPPKATPTASTAARTHVVRIVSPGPDEQVLGPAVSIRYATEGQFRPTLFRLQLDSDPAVETNAPSYTFENLAPGRHEIKIAAVNRWHHPVRGSEAQSAFTLMLPQPNTQLVYPPVLPESLQKVAMYIPKVTAPSDPPDGNGEMPLLSVIGLGVLVGGMVSAMKTRS